MAEGGATYTVNIELATRQFSQDLRNLKNKIKRDLGKAVKVSTGGSNANTIREKTLALRREQHEKQEQRKEKYRADLSRAQLIEKQRLIEGINKLQSFGYSNSEVKKLRNWAGEIDSLARGNPQAAQQRIKELRAALDFENKTLDLLNKQVEAEKKLVAETNKKAAAEKKVQDRAKKVADAKKTEADARRAERLANKAEARENRQRKGPQGIRMHGPVDGYGNPIYQTVPTVPKSGASLPVNLGRKTTGTIATKHTQLLRRREVLETLLKTFDGVKTEEVRKFKTGIQSLLTQYKKVSTLQGKMKPQGKGYSETGGWGEWKNGKLITKDRIGNAGNIARELEQLENLTKREESRAKRIKATNESELKAAKRKSAFLNKEHSARKLIERLKKKGVKTTELELKLEKAITAQDKDQLDTAAREIDMINAKSTRAGKGGKKGGGSGGGTTSTKAGGKGNFGRIASAAGISGGFPLLFGQSPGVAAFSALGGGIGEALSPGGGFAGGIVASAIATKVAEVIQFRTEVSNLNKDMAAMGVSSEFSAGQIAKLGKALRVTKQEALEIAKGFKKYGGKRGGLFAEFFGDAQLLEVTAGANDIQSAIAAIKAQQKDMTTEEELGYRIKLLNEGVEETINALLEKRIALRKKDFEASQKEAKKKASLTGPGAFGLGVQSFVFEQQAKKDLEDLIEKEKEIIVQFEKERDLRNELSLAAERQAQSINKAIESTEKELRKLNNAQYQVVELANSISSAFSESFKGIVSGSMTAQEALANLFQKTADHFLDMAARMAAAQMQQGILKMFANAFGPGIGSYGNIVPNTSTSFSTQQAFSGKAMLNYADGGRPPKGRASIVGERGPELFVPDSAGTIVPNHAMGGANVVVNVDASGSSVEGDAGQSEELGSMLAAAVQAELVNQQRPGGLLAGTR